MSLCTWHSFPGQDPSLWIRGKGWPITIDKAEQLPSSAGRSFLLWAELGGVGDRGGGVGGTLAMSFYSHRLFQYITWVEGWEGVLLFARGSPPLLLGELKVGGIVAVTSLLQEAEAFWAWYNTPPAEHQVPESQVAPQRHPGVMVW